MAKALPILLLLTAAARAPHGPPRPPRAPRHLTKVISAAACNLANGFADYGPGVVETFGPSPMLTWALVADSYLDDSMMADLSAPCS